MLPTGLASTVAPLDVAADAAADAAGAAEGAVDTAGAAEGAVDTAGAADGAATEAAGASLAGAADPPLLELQPATTAMTNSGAARARKRMGMSVTSLRIGVVGRVEPNTERYVRCPHVVCAFAQTTHRETKR